MRFYKYYFGIIILAISLAGCANGEDDHGNEGEIVEVGGEVGFSDFIENFNEVNLPYYLPGAKPAKALKEIDKTLIRKYLENNEFKPAFGPESAAQQLTENLDSSVYYYDAKLSKTQGYSGIIILKESQISRSKYYYLCNFTPAGIFIDGMCIAFTSDKKSSGSAERTATINEDMSIHIRQQPEGDTAGNAQSRFYELTPEGKIAGIQLGI